MDSKALLNADYLDIVFDNRNKSYGGYQLRRSYGQRVGKAVAILYSVVAVVVLVAAFRNQDVRASTEHIPRPAVLTEFYVPPPPAPAVELPPAPPAKPKAVMPQTVIATPPVITNEPFPDNEQMPDATTMARAVPGTTNVGDGDAPNIMEPAGSSGTANVMPVADKPEVPVRIVDQMPEFSGDLMKYLAAHVHYPELARNAGVEGRVVIEFVVNEDGHVTNARVVRGIGGGCDEEALRVVKAMPIWKAGRQNGRKVKVFYMLPIMFALQ